jgi:hypothetical protein
MMSYPGQSAIVGDTITFTWTGNFHNSYLHPSLSCSEDGRIEVGTSSPATYTFTEADGTAEGNILLFACDAGNHCENGMQISITVYSTREDKDAVTPAPHDSPTPAPHSDCDDNVIYTNKDCYVKGENIDVFFRQCSPEVDDWVGVYYSTEDNQDLGNDYRLWVWACGNQVCQGTVEVGAITFDNGYPQEAGTDSWPLEASDETYQVHLIRRNSGGPYSSNAESNTFRVVDYHETCGTPPGPTSAPLPGPTPAPHPGPMPSPITCQNSIESDASCYVEDEDAITIMFSNCDPENMDWVGIFYSDDNPNQLGFPLFWVWACGTQQCTDSVSSGTIVFDSGDPNESALDSWPLNDGNYRAHLIQGASPAGHYIAYASSDEFRVERNSCTTGGNNKSKGNNRRRR